MKLLIARWLALLTFRCGPADLPHAPLLLGALLMVAFALDWIGSRLMQPLAGEPWWSLLRAAIGMGLLWALLASSARAARFVQTAIAMQMVAIAVNLAFCRSCSRYGRCRPIRGQCRRPRPAWVWR